MSYESMIEEFQEIPDLSYQFAFLEIQDKLKTEWRNLKKLLPADNAKIAESAKNIDTILNYFYE